MLRSVENLLAHYPSKHLGVAGGVFANVKLNRLLAERLPLDEIFIFPAMGDEGLPVGSALIYLLERDGLKSWLDRRRPLGPIFLGRDYTSAIDPALAALPGARRVEGAPVAEAVRRLANGEIGAIFTGRMEYGPRALGARSILANPSRRETHDLLNQRLARTEFMPFAPVIAAERAADVFDVNAVNARACQYMTIACDVHRQWRDRIPAVVHVDGSARPQTIRREDNRSITISCAPSRLPAVCRCWSTPASTCTRSRSSIRRPSAPRPCSTAASILSSPTTPFTSLRVDPNAFLGSGPLGLGLSISDG